MRKGPHLDPRAFISAPSFAMTSLCVLESTLTLLGLGFPSQKEKGLNSILWIKQACLKGPSLWRELVE